MVTEGYNGHYYFALYLLSNLFLVITHWIKAKNLKMDVLFANRDLDTNWVLSLTCPN